MEQVMDPQMQQAMMALLMQQQGGSMQPQPASLFQAWNRPPMIGGGTVRPSQMFDLSGMPGFSGNSQTGQLLGMLMQGVLPRLMGPNFTMGQFAPSQNFFDHRYAQQYFMQRRQAIEGASAAEAETYFRMIRGMSRMAGVEYETGGPQEASARRFGQDIASMMPTFQGFLPTDTFDRIHGMRGSRSLLAGSVFDAGRYTFDPVSGRLGMSGTSATAISNEVYSTLYGPGANLANMRGLGAGRAGQIYDEMIRRGFGPPSFVDDREAVTALSRELTRPEAEITSPAMRQLRQRSMDLHMRAPGQGLRADEVMADIQNLQATDPQAFDAAMRSFDGARSARMIHQMAGAVSAMRDIFGDMGRPNAPMVELLNGLQAMTQGGMSHMTPQQIEKSVRQTAAMAKYTGMGLEVAMGFMGTANQVLQGQGLPTALAPEIGRSAMAYSFAYGRTERPLAIGVPDPEAAGQIYTRLRAQAAGSPAAVRLAAFMQLRDTMPADASGARNFAEGTEARALADAIAANSNVYRFGGQERSVFRSLPQMQDVLQGTGVNRSSYTLAAMQPASAMQDTIRQYGLDALVQENQARIDSPELIRVYQGAAASGLNLYARGVPRERRARLQAQLGQAVYDEMQNIIDTDPSLGDASRRGDLHQALQERITARLGPQALAGVSPEALQRIIGDMRSRINTYIPRSRYAGYQTDIGYFTIHSGQTRRIRQRTEAETRSISEFQRALSSIGQTQLEGRVSDYLQEVGPGGGTVQDFLRRAVGGIPAGEVSVAAGAMVEHVAGLQRQMDYNAETFRRDPRQLAIEQARVMAELEALAPDIRTIFSSEAGNMGVLTPHAERILERYRTRTGPGGARPGGGMLPTDPRIERQRDEALRLQRAWNTRRTDSIELRHDVRGARAAVRATEGELSFAQGRLTAAVETPTVREARERVTTLEAEMRRLDTQIAANPQGGLAQSLMEQREQRRKELQQAITARDAAITNASAQPLAVTAQGDVTRLTQQLQNQQRALDTTLATAGQAVDSSPEVIAASLTMTQAFAELNTMQRGAGLPETRTLTPAQIAAADAGRRLREARDTALERLAPVREARGQRNAAQTNLEEASNALNALINTPEVRRRRDAVNARSEAVIDLDRQIAAAEAAPDAGTRAGRDRIAALRAQRSAAGIALTTAQAAYSGPHGAYTQAVANTPGASIAEALVRRRETELTTAQGNLATVIGQQNVESDSNVRAARLARERALIQAGVPMTGPAGAQEPSRPGVPGVPGTPPGGPGMPGAPGLPGMVPGRAGVPAGGAQVQALQISSTQTTIPNAHVDISTSAVTITRTGGPTQAAGEHIPAEGGVDVQAANFTSTPAPGGDDTTNPVTGAAATQRINGTLRIEGNTATFVDTTSTTVDARSPRFSGNNHI